MAACSEVKHVGAGVRVLQRLGRRDLARPLRRASFARNAAAHPDLSLAREICGALRAQAAVDSAMGEVLLDEVGDEVIGEGSVVQACEKMEASLCRGSEKRPSAETENSVVHVAIQHYIGDGNEAECEEAEGVAYVPREVQTDVWAAEEVETIGPELEGLTVVGFESRTL